MAKESELMHRRMTMLWGKRIKAALNASIQPMLATVGSVPANVSADAIDLTRFNELLIQMYKSAIVQKSKWTKAYFKDEAGIKRMFGFPEMQGDLEAYKALVYEYLSTYASEMIVTLNANTRSMAIDIINRAVEDAQLSGVSVFDLAKEIEKNVLQEWRATNAFRAFTIARTELHNSLEWSSLETAKSLEVPFVKQWQTWMDGRERASHRSVNGQRVKPNEPFNVDGDRMLIPGDNSFGASAGNVINCRCVCLHVPTYKF